MMRVRRNGAVVRLVATFALLLAVGGLAILAKPQWREYFLEAVVLLGALWAVRRIADLMLHRFLGKSVSPFEKALQRERSSQQPPSQWWAVSSMAASPETSTFDLLSEAAESRLNDRFGFGLNDDRARDILGTEVFDLLRMARRPGPLWTLRKQSFRFPVRFPRDIARFVRRRSTGNARNIPNSTRSASVEQVRTILNRLEQL
jgi:hypothetical protein